MFEAITFVMMILSVSMFGVIFKIPEIYTMSINFLITVWMGLNLWKLKAPFLPSSKNKIHTMMRLASIQQGDVVYELGAGDGRILRAAYSYKPSKIVGYELSPRLVYYARLLNTLRKETIVYQRADIFEQDLSDADVIFCFLLPQGMNKIEHEIRPKLKSGTKIVSNTFTFPNIQHHTAESSVYYYIKE